MMTLADATLIPQHAETKQQKGSIDIKCRRT
ncbi:hypothetical protein AVEN_249601-1, partial [Araneus ventricosus]